MGSILLVNRTDFEIYKEAHKGAGVQPRSSDAHVLHGTPGFHSWPWCLTPASCQCRLERQQGMVQVIGLPCGRPGFCFRLWSWTGAGVSQWIRVLSVCLCLSLTF